MNERTRVYVCVRVCAQQGIGTLATCTNQTGEAPSKLGALEAQAGMGALEAQAWVHWRHKHGCIGGTSMGALEAQAWVHGACLPTKACACCET